MTGIDQAKTLLERQYKDASKLNARIALHVRFSTNPEPWWGWVWRMMALPGDARILEVGTGPASFWQANLARIPDSWDITLSDFSPGMLHRARTNLGEARKRFAFARINVVDVPFSDTTFDGVIANFMLYHAHDLDQAITELHRVLKPGGRLYAATNGLRHMKQLRDLLQQLDPETIDVSASARFGLHNGAEALHHRFPTINCYFYDDTLRVTETKPLVAYALSMDHSPQLLQNPEPLRQAIREKIERDGEFFIEKHSGLFEAIKENVR